MDKNGVITIKDWFKGTGDSPYTGFGQIQSCEIFDTPGVIKPALKVELQSSASGITVARVKASTGDIFTLVRVEGGTSYITKNGSTYTNISGDAWDMVEYSGYIIVSSTAGLSCFGTTNSTAFFSLFKTGLTDKYYVKLLTGQDDKLYITNGNSIATISSFVAGTFSVAPTCTLTANALDLKDGQYAVTIQELGTNIMVGTQTGLSWSERVSHKVANIYPWNRQAGTLGNPGLADLPIILNECGIHAMLSIDNLLYVVAGTRGNVYVTDGTSCKFIKRIPWTQSRTYLNSIMAYPNAIFRNSNGNLLIGISQNAGILGTGGVYEMQLQSSDKEPIYNYPTVYKYVPSGGGNCEIGFVTSDETDTVYFGWETSSSGGVDYTTGATVNGYAAFIESPLFITGGAEKKKTFQQFEFLLGKPLTNSQGIKFYYRKNTQDAYILVGTYTFASLGTRVGFEDKCSISDTQQVQFKIELENDSQSSPVPQWDLELINVRVW